MTKKFKHLRFPETWEQYWTRYPQGYTIMEALINWVSQVNEMSDNINDWNDYLDEFVATWDKDLQTQVVNLLGEWKKDGTLDDIINQNIFEDLNEQLAQTEESIRLITYNIKDFGAKGDGTTDDTQAFINATTDEKVKKLFIPPGVYIVKNPIVLQNIEIFGVKDNSIIKYDGYAADGLLRYKRNVKTHDLTLQSNGNLNSIIYIDSNNTGEQYINLDFKDIVIDGGGDINAIELIARQYFGYHGVNFKDIQITSSTKTYFTNGISIKSVQPTTTQRPWITNCDFSFIYIDYAKNAIHFEWNKVDGVTVKPHNTRLSFNTITYQWRDRSERFAILQNVIRSQFKNIKIFDNENANIPPYLIVGPDVGVSIDGAGNVVSLDQAVEFTDGASPRNIYSLTSDIYMNFGKITGRKISTSEEPITYSDVNLQPVDMTETDGALDTFQGIFVQNSWNTQVGKRGSFQFGTNRLGHLIYRYHDGTEWSKWYYVLSERTGIQGFSRPENPAVGQYMFDRNLNKPIWWTGSNWVDANGTEV